MQLDTTAPRAATAPGSAPRAFLFALADAWAGSALALRRLGCCIAGLVHCEADKDARKAVRLRWPGVIAYSLPTLSEACAAEALGTPFKGTFDVIVLAVRVDCFPEYLSACSQVSVRDYLQEVETRLRRLLCRLATACCGVRASKRWQKTGYEH